MGSEILTTNGKFIFNTPITRDVHEIWYRHCEDNTPNLCWKPYCKAKNHFCWDHERMSGTIASYDTSSGTYQIGMCDNQPYVSSFRRPTLLASPTLILKI